MQTTLTDHIELSEARRIGQKPPEPKIEIKRIDPDSGLQTAFYDAVGEGYDELHREEQENKLRIINRFPAEFLPKKDDTLLDVGCGSGISTGPWECTCIGVDPSIELIKIAKKKSTNQKAPTGKDHFFVASAENLPFKEDTFDFVISLTAIHNFEDIKQGILEIKRVGRRNFILTVLKKSRHVDKITKLIMINFRVKKIVMEDKDIIYACEKLF